MIRTRALAVDGPLVLVPTVHRDDRGHLVETFRASEFEAAGIRDVFVQHAQSRSSRGTLRGLHYQASPSQSRLVRVANGSIHDVVVDLRPGSPTFGQHAQVELDDVDHIQLYVPPGFAHGYCVLSETADVVYLTSSYYDPDRERGIAWDDSDLAIDWPVAEPTLSLRDQTNPTFRSIEASLRE